MCKWLILSVKVRMAILGKAPGIGKRLRIYTIVVFSFIRTFAPSF